jgi:tetratricopeptide (TPR) repeat protein
MAQVTGALGGRGRGSRPSADALTRRASGGDVAFLIGRMAVGLIPGIVLHMVLALPDGRWAQPPACRGRRGHLLCTGLGGVLYQLRPALPWSAVGVATFAALAVGLPASHARYARAGPVNRRRLRWLGRAAAVGGETELVLASIGEAVEIRRRLAETNPAAYLPGLTMSLNNLGIRLSEVGRLEEALATASEAVVTYRRLAEASPAAYLPDLAVALNNLGIRLSELGRREDGLAAIQEAVTTYRRLADPDGGNPAAYLPGLAGALNNLGIRPSEVGRLEEALALGEEAVVIRRRLVDANPAAYLPDLAGSLNNLGIRLSEVGRLEEALAPAGEAVEIYRGLAEANPAAYLPDLAMSLWALGWVCAAGRFELRRGLAAVEEAVSIYWEPGPPAAGRVWRHA